MIWTNISSIGDFFLLWPVASAYYKETNNKIHWVLTQNYYMYPIIKETLKYQDFTENVSLVNVGVDAWDEDQWKFNPAKFGIEGEYMNFGFTQNMHGKYIPDFYASLYDLKVDNDYCIKIHDYLLTPFEKVTMKVESRPGLWLKWKSMMPADVVDLADLAQMGYCGYGDYNQTEEHKMWAKSEAGKVYAASTWFPLKLWYSAKAKERHFGCSSSAVLMDLMNLPCNIYTHNGLGDPKIYYRNNFHKIIYPYP